LELTNNYKLFDTDIIGLGCFQRWAGERGRKRSELYIQRALHLKKTQD
jgi:hypothetical protein